MVPWRPFAIQVAAQVAGSEKDQDGDIRRHGLDVAQRRGWLYMERPCSARVAGDDDQDQGGDRRRRFHAAVHNGSHIQSAAGAFTAFIEL